MRVVLTDQNNESLIEAKAGDGGRIAEEGKKIVWVINDESDYFRLT